MPKHQDNTNNRRKEESNIKQSEDYSEYYRENQQRSSSSFVSPSRSLSSVVDKEDLPKAVTEPPTSNNLTSDDIATEVEEYLAENRKRKDTMATQCRSFVSESREKGGYLRIVAKTMQARRPRAQMFSIDPRKRLAWCRTPKVATTTWARIMLQLYGVKKFGHYHSQMKRTEKRFVSHWNKKKVVSSLVNKQRKYTSLVLARHPMDRLFSAFRDKILRKR